MPLLTATVPLRREPETRLAILLGNPLLGGEPSVRLGCVSVCIRHCFRNQVAYYLYVKKLISSWKYTV